VPIPARAKDFSLLQNVQGSGAQAAPYSMSAKVLSWEKSGWGMTLNTHLHPTPRMRISGATPLLPLHDFIDRTRTSLPFTFYHKEARRVPIWGTTLNNYRLVHFSHHTIRYKK
jgi:hypothetical protein